MIGILVWLVQISSYSYTVLVNPGVVKQDMNFRLFSSSSQNLKIKNYRICSTCEVIMNLDDHTSHCDDCGVCIEGKTH
jgi:hypothetical protein